MRITVFGAAGSVGRSVVLEALSRGHEVTGVVRHSRRFAELPPGTHARVGDARYRDDVVAATEGQDVAIAATRPAHGQEHDLVVATAGLLDGVAKTGVRLLAVGGAGSLLVPGGDGLTVVDTPEFPASWRPIADACDAQLDAYRAAPESVDWTYLSPPALLEPGKRTGRYRLGTDHLVVGANGESRISVDDLAAALLDEAEDPRHRRMRFTVGY